MGYGFPQFSVVFSCIIMILLTTALNTIQNSLLIFGKYRAHIWVVDFEKNKNKFQNFKDNYWNYYLRQKYILHVSSAIVAFLIMLIITEIIPNIISRGKTIYILSLFHSLIRFTDAIFKPLRYIFQKIVSGLLMIFGAAYHTQNLTLEDGDVKSLFKAAANQGILKKHEFDMITNIFELKDTIVKNIMIPAMDVTAAPASISYNDLLQLFKTSGYSRLPVYEENRDNIIGVIHAKEFLSANINCNELSPRNFIRKIIYAPESKELNSLLHQFQKNKVHIAVVVDEFGVFSGIITIEDVLEEIVGEIQDEFDEDEQDIIKIKDTEYLIDAKISVEELNEKLKINLPVTSEYESLGGFLIYIADELPAQHQAIEFKDFTFTVQVMTKTRLLKIKMEL